MRTHHLVICADARSLQEVEDETVQLVAIAPPYFNPRHPPRNNDYIVTKDLDTYISFIREVFSHCTEKLRDGGHLAFIKTDVRFNRCVIPLSFYIAKVCLSLGLTMVRHFIWRRQRGISLYSPQFTNVIVFCKGHPRNTNYMNLPDVWDIPYRAPRTHSTATASEVYRILIENFSSVGDTILDPFLGSGTCSEVALKLSRNSIGYEIVEEYMVTIIRRLSEAKAELGVDSEIEVVKRN